MLIIFTGNGKGKTTAALGQSLRAAGRGKRVLVVQFIKGPWKSGEDISCRLLAPNMKIVKAGKGFVGIGGDRLPREAHMRAARYGLAYARRQAMARKWDIIVLDEIWNALSLGLVSPNELRRLISSIKSRVEHVIMTGRDCPPEFMDEADLVTEMRDIKHPFAAGVAGTKGLEY